MRVLYANPGSPSWNVIAVVARLAARLMDAELLELDIATVRLRRRRALSMLPRRRPGRAEDALLVIAPEPVDLNAVLQMRSWIRPTGPVAGWVIDSWWEDRIPAVARKGFYDLLYVSEREFQPTWRARTGADTRWLAQGSNALDWGSARGDRRITVQRVGRQPVEWDDDVASGDALRAAGLTFAGRPPFEVTPDAAMAGLLTCLADARFSLAFSPRVDRQPYVHPTHDYMTGRWTDSLAAGAVVAGVAPRTASVRELLWPGALLELPGTERAQGIDAIAAADARWTPQVAFMNHLGALKRLDWRWRIAQIAADLGVVSRSLDEEMARLDRRISELESDQR